MIVIRTICLSKQYQILTILSSVDKQINEYFIETAFPKKDDCEKVLEVLRNYHYEEIPKIKYYSSYGRDFTGFKVTLNL